MKKNIVALSLIIFVLLFSLILFLALSNKEGSKSKKIEKTTKDYFTTPGVMENSELLTTELMKKISLERVGSKEFLDASVKDYESKQTVEDIKIISQSENSTEAELAIKVVTTNKKTGANNESLDVYKASFVQDEGQWKINNIEYLNSK